MNYTFKTSARSSHALLLNSLPDRGEGRTVLDVGCGDGYLGARLSTRGFHVTGIEQPGGFSPDFPSHVTLIAADLERGLPPLKSRFDYVICADILEHLRDPLGLLRQIRTVLSQSGVLIASLPNSGNFWFRGNVLLGRFPQDDKGLFDRTHVRFYMWDGWQTLLREAGFEIAKVEPTPVPVSLMVAPRWENSLAVRFAESVFYGLARIWRTMFAYQFVITSRLLSR